MNENKIKNLLKNIKNGEIEIDEAYKSIVNMPFEDVDFAKIDYHRQLRKGFPEVIYCEGKTKEHIVEIMKKLFINSDKNILATRASADIYHSVKSEINEAEYFKTAKLIRIKKGSQKSIGNILVVSAGTADLPIAEEAAVTAETMGNKVERAYDVGVAGLHRLFLQKEKIDRARVIIVVAGMEGALASVVGGLVNKPVIAVPTSIGYGSSFNGLAALLSMLNSCASGVSVVNIDNGFGAGYSASLINKLGGC
jgi:hypothetical protein